MRRNNYPLANLERRERQRDYREIIGLAVVTVLVLIIGSVWQAHKADARSEDSRADYLRQVLPYYKQVPPSWCYEDMACWAGSVDDNRSNRQLVQSLPLHY